MKYVFTMIITAAVTGTVVFFTVHEFKFNEVSISKNNNSDKSLDEDLAISLQENIEYYRDIAGYLYLLDQESFKKVEEFGRNLHKNQNLTDSITILYLESLFSNSPELKDEIVNIINAVKAKKEESDYFERNTTCEALIPGVKSGLESKEKTYLGENVAEEFEAIFYSPTLESCVYITNYNETDYDDGYSSETFKRVYKTSTDDHVNSYRVYSSEDLDSVSSKDKSTSGKREFVKYILENSNYSVTIFDSVSYIHVSL